MTLNKKIVIFFVCSLMVLIAYLIFMQILLKEIAPAGHPVSIQVAPPQETGALEGGPGANYAIPINTVPSVQDIEKSIKIAEEKRRQGDEIRAKIELKKNLRGTERGSSRRETPAVEPAQAGATAEKTVFLPEKKEPVTPSREERQRMESNGIMTY